jgi:LemA protein
MSTKNLTLIVIVGLILLLGGCGCNSYNSMNGLKQQANEAFSNVDNQYKRRSDLIGNLVNTVKGAANFEKETLTQVIQARASATSIKVDPNDLTPEKMQQFQARTGPVITGFGQVDGGI